MPAPPISLVVTDLDGTLWDADERIHERSLAALRQLQHRNVPLLVATGRRPRSASVALARHGLTPPAVFLDGAIGKDLATGEEFLRRPFSRAAAAAVLDVFAAGGLSPCVYVERPGVDVVVGERPSTSERHLQLLDGWVEQDDLARVVATEDVLAFAVAGRDAALLEPVADGLGSDAEAAVTRDVFLGGTTLMVRPSGVSKWEGVVAFCERHDIDPGHVLAVGDGQNDIELLRGARVRCVVRDGCDEAVALAHHLLDPPAGGGWSAILGLL